MFSCCLDMFPHSGPKRGPQNACCTLLKGMKCLCRPLRPEANTAPEKVLCVQETEEAQGVHFSHWPPSAQCGIPLSVERSLKHTRNIELVTHVHRNWLEYIKPMMELHEASSPGVQQGSAVAQGTGLEPGQFIDWTPTVTRGPEGTGESAPAYAVLEQQESPAGLLGQEEKAQDDPGSSGATEYIKPVEDLLESEWPRLVPWLDWEG
ncbi:uncharacterized protein LOC129146513 [Talpa occidentalis]|uniref:uncharacterized protein LOC129146513 n=1 Tax=Talpa occidentalis TaxID=50954 RepID=UPI0023FA2597|nr:uncharacterized protein LOC129146513 [Talpa occidentalis]